MTERPMDEYRIDRYSVIERTDRVLKIEQRMPQEEIGKIVMKGMNGWIVGMMIAIVAIGVLMISIDTMNFRFLERISPITYLFFALPVALTTFLVIFYAIMRHAIVFTTVVLDKDTGSCTIESITRSRSERKLLRMKRRFQLGYANTFRVIPVSELPGKSDFATRLIKKMSKGLISLIHDQGPGYMPFFIFSDFEMAPLLEVKKFIDEFLYQPSTI